MSRRTGWVRRLWTKADDRKLFAMAGNTSGPELLAAFPGRDVDSIRHRARRLGITDLFQGTWTLKRLCQETGYDWSQFYRARDALGQVWKRRASQRPHRAGGPVSTVGRHLVITEAQAQAMIEYLKDEPAPFVGVTKDGVCFQKRTWSVKWKACRSCGQAGTNHAGRHHGKGLCRRCYLRAARAAKRSKRQAEGCGIIESPPQQGGRLDHG